MSEVERDLGVQKASRQVCQAVKKTNSILAFIVKGLECKKYGCVVAIIQGIKF